MPEFLSAALSHPGLAWLALVAAIAGIVRGFAGFGTAMVYMPAAAQVLDPFAALITLTLIDVVGPMPNVPRALRDGNRAEVARLCAGLIVAMPVGLLLLSRVDPEVFRYAVSLITLGLLILLISGYRYRHTLKRWMTYGAGMVGGFLAGSTGLAGPPVIMLYMASSSSAAAIRANLILYLLAIDILMVVMLTVMGKMTLVMVGLSLILTVPYLAGNVLGGILFQPRLEGFYRAVAYVIIAISALTGLPFLD